MGSKGDDTEEWPLARAVRKGEVVLNQEIEILRGDGSRGTLLTSASPLRARDGEVVGIVTSLLNPTNEDVFIGIGFAIPIDDAGGVIGFPPV